MILDAAFPEKQTVRLAGVLTIDGAFVKGKHVCCRPHAAHHTDCQSSPRPRLPPGDRRRLRTAPGTPGRRWHRRPSRHASHETCGRDSACYNTRQKLDTLLAEDIIFWSVCVCVSLFKREITSVSVWLDLLSRPQRRRRRGNSRVCKFKLLK